MTHTQKADDGTMCQLTAVWYVFWGAMLVLLCTSGCGGASASMRHQCRTRAQIRDEEAATRQANAELQKMPPISYEQVTAIQARNRRDYVCAEWINWRIEAVAATSERHRGEQLYRVRIHRIEKRCRANERYVASETDDEALLTRSQIYPIIRGIRCTHPDYSARPEDLVGTGFSAPMEYPTFDVALRYETRLIEEQYGEPEPP